MADCAAVVELLIPDVKAKFDRYTSGDPKALTFSGFKYLLKGCPGLELSEDKLDDLFKTSSTQDSATTTSKLSFDMFKYSLRLLSAMAYPTETSGDRRFLEFLVNFFIPMRLDEPAVMRALDMVALQQPSAIELAAPLGRKSTQQPKPPLAAKEKEEKVEPGSPELPKSQVVATPKAISEASDAKTIKSFEGPPTVVLGQRLKHMPLANGPSILVRDFLSSLRLEEYLHALNGLGVDCVEDLSELSAADLQTAGLKPLHARRLLDAIGRWSPRHRHAENLSPTNVSSHPENAVAPHVTAATDAEVPLATAPIEWEEYATNDGFMYYHNVKTGATQWQKPSGIIRTVLQRHKEQLSIAALVEERVAAALTKSRPSSPLRSISPARAPKRPLTLAEALSVPGSRASVSSQETWRSTWNDVLTGNGNTQETKEDAKRADGVAAASAVLKAHASLTSGYAVPPPENTANSSPVQSSPAKPFVQQQQDMADSAHSDQSAYNTYSGMYEANTAASPQPRHQQGLMSPPGYLRGFLNQQRADSLHTGVELPKATVMGVTISGDVAPGRHYLSQRSPTPRSSRAASRRVRFDRDDESLASGDDRGTIASLASTVYPDVFDALPSMDERTFDILARHNMISNSKVMGYADPRPDIRPSAALFPAANPARTMSAARPLPAYEVRTTATGMQGKADGLWASQLRPHLHSQVNDPKAAKSAEELRKPWGGEICAPSEIVSGYAYRHAAASSMYAEAGTVFDRLTDARGYTGTHRHRFDEDGRGTGLAGRENSFDYQKLVDSVSLEPSKGAPTLPLLGDFASQTPGTSKR